MTKVFELLCLKTHDVYTKGKIYKCEYDNLMGEEFYRVFGDDNIKHYLRKGNSYGNLNYFFKAKRKYRLKFYKRSKILILINRIFGFSIDEYINTTKTYNFTGISTDLFGKVYLDIIAPIESVLKSELYLQHQEKFHYILSSILKINKLSEHMDINKRLVKYEKLIKDVLESIKIQNERADEEVSKSINPVIKKYIDNEDILLNNWESCLKEVWNSDLGVDKKC